MKPRNVRRSTQTVKATVIAFATSWGRKHGGINSFNVDFLTALREVAPSLAILCVVPQASSDDFLAASSKEIRLLTLPSAGPDVTDPSLQHILSALRDELNCPKPWIWVGHDIITGPQAVAFRDSSGEGTCALINHVSYSDYAAVKHLDPQRATEKHRLQKRLFSAADVLFAVGPLLKDRLTDLVPNIPVHMLVPGISNVLVDHATSRLCAVAFGRLDLENDRIKQGRLVAVAFARAVAHARIAAGLQVPIFENATLKLLGLDENPAVRKAILATVEKEARRAIDLRLLPYLEDRELFRQELDGTNLSLFLSWHEGFGLSAWEAIGAGIPLIVSRATGVFKLLEQIGGVATGCVTAVDIRGSYGLDGEHNYRREDVHTVRDAIIEVGTRLTRKLKDADDLRRLLQQQEGFTWSSMAQKFAQALGITTPGLREAATLPQEVNARVEKMLNEFDLKNFHRTLSVVNTLLVTGRYDSALSELKFIDLEGAPESAIAELHLLRSEIHLRLNEYTDAQRFAQDGSNYFEATQNWSKLLKAKGVLNTINRDLGSYERAVQIAESMLLLAREKAPTELGSVQRKLARSLALDRQWKRSVEEATSALRFAKQIQNIDEQAKAHLACGEAHRHGFVQTSAIEEYRAAIALATTTGDWDCFLWSALGLADSYLLAGWKTEAREVLSKVERLVSETGRRFPIETLHYQLSLSVLNFLEGKNTQKEFGDLIARYARLGVTWPKSYIAELKSTGRAAEPKRM